MAIYYSIIPQIVRLVIPSMAIYYSNSGYYIWHYPSYYSLAGFYNKPLGIYTTSRTMVKYITAPEGISVLNSPYGYIIGIDFLAFVSVFLLN